MRNGKVRIIKAAKRKSKAARIKSHLKDIDWRTHEARQAEAIPEIKRWYESAERNGDIQQQRAFSAVLWLLMEPKDYKAFVTQITPEEAIEAADEATTLNLLEIF